MARCGAEWTVMKLRIRGNSIRIRMDRKDLAKLLHCGRVIDAARFGPGVDRALTYAVEVGPAPRKRPHADYVAGRLLVTIDRDDVEEWSQGDHVGFDHAQAVEGGVVRVILEKDFACLDRSAGQEAEDAWAFPNPSSGVCS
jgi:Family of unknown function (DUF7009)